MITIPVSWTVPLVNHLWQSTAFTVATGFMVLALRNNQARVRHGLWMLASAKFLIPFSVLIAAGGYLQSAMAKPVSQPSLSAVMEEIAQPFSQAQAFANVEPDVSSSVFLPHNGSVVPVVLLGLWLGGSFLVAFSWWRKWRRVRAAVHAASYLAVVGDVPVLSSPSLLEPGVFGVLRPVLMLPQGITGRLNTPQLSAIIAHEICHVRRRDNLTAAIHMAVEVVFWFHPFVWWIRTRLVEERERACDEAVLQSGSKAHVYAEGILNVCKFYIESPLACVSGVTGSDLKKRIVRIMSEQVARRLNLSKKLLLSAAGVLAIALPIVFGLVHSTQVRAQAVADNAAQGIVGTWQGTLPLAKELRVVVKITKAESGGWKAVFYSIDQGGQSIPVSATTLQGSNVKLSVEAIDGRYEGKLSADGNSIAGTWTQGPGSHPLNLTRATPETAWTIPEPPPKLPPMAADANPSFEVATIKPSKPETQGKGFRVQGRHFSTMNTSLNDLITFAYGLHDKQIVGGPAWMGADKYDLSAQPDGEGQPNDKQWKVMIQKLLAERFKLTFHRDKKELSVYALALGKNGSLLKKSEGDPNGLPSLFFRGLGILPGRNATMEDFAGVMQSAVLDRPVVDQTGLQGRFDFILKWTPDESQFGGLGAKVPLPSENADAPPNLFTAIQEQMGLKLEPTKAPVAVLVIDHVEKPSEN
ncbi:M56 family metallopeptidase [Granulicella sp. dw_53]|uniref:M56 family metallopeptidase n=1 Tax=Granulicella sp. dw_53 TaxID=2719792 RepID=UPI001BD2AB48|nr:M56 family metallopeptidase [Granulicella sp. dw_53]